MKRSIFLLVSLLLSTLSFGAKWVIGFGQVYAKPSDVVNIINDRDTIYIDPGMYEQDACKWKNKNLVFVGMGEGQLRTTIKYTGNIPNGKGIWVFENPGTNDNIKIVNIDFEGAQVSDNDGGNGAAIRFQANNLEILGCNFRNCQNGILEGHGAVVGSNILIKNSTFYNNGYQEQNNSNYSGYEHNIYISASTDTLWVENCLFHHPRGQANSLKTRALNSFILYNMFDEEDGYGSYEINIAQGGNIVILGNVIVQGTSGANHSIVGFDDAINPVNELYFVNNTVINKFPGNNRYFNISPSSGITVFKVYNNIFASISAASNTFISGNVPAALDTSNNYFSKNYLTIGFNSPETNDFSLTKDATTLIDKGTDAGNSKSGFPLMSEFSYFNFNSPLINRFLYGNAIDIGAYEYEFISKTKKAKTDFNISIYPNPTNGQFLVQMDDIHKTNIILRDIKGQLVSHKIKQLDKDSIFIDLQNNFKGPLFITFINHKQVVTKKMIIL